MKWYGVRYWRHVVKSIWNNPIFCLVSAFVSCNKKFVIKNGTLSAQSNWDDMKILFLPTLPQYPRRSLASPAGLSDNSFYKHEYWILVRCYWQMKTEILIKTCPITTLSTTNLICNSPGLNPGPCVQKSVINRLSYGTAARLNCFLN